MITIKTKEDIETLREGGKRHAYILSELAKLITPGVSTFELEDRARTLIEEGGDKASFLGYKPRGARRPFPAALCVSINEEIVHGIPNETEKILRNGDIVSLDLGLTHKKLITDSAISLPVGRMTKEESKMLAHCKEALYRGIKEAVVGNRVGDISHAIGSFLRPFGYGIIEGLSGHGVGYAVHEDPFVPNEGSAHTGEVLKPGMVIAIEPMISLGSSIPVLQKDGYTYSTKDGSKAVHFEHTVAITENGPLILTE